MADCPCPPIRSRSPTARTRTRQETGSRSDASRHSGQATWPRAMTSSLRKRPESFALHALSRVSTEDCSWSGPSTVALALAIILRYESVGGSVHLSRTLEFGHYSPACTHRQRFVKAGSVRKL